MKKKPVDPKRKPEEDQKSQKPGKEDHFYERWKNPTNNTMGNDISGDMKIANSNGDLDGGKNKRWHMDDEEQ